MQDRILSLPDEAFYHLLITLPLRDCVLLERAYAEERSKVFLSARRTIAVEEDLDREPPLTFLEMFKIDSAENPDEETLLLLDHGDFPKRIEKIIKELDDVGAVFYDSLERKREQSSLLLCKQYLEEGGDENYALYDSIRHRSDLCTSYLVKYMKGKDILTLILDDDERYCSYNDVKYAMRFFDTKVTAKQIGLFLSKLNPNGIYFLEYLLQRASLEEIEQAYKDHLHRLETGYDAYGGDYLPHVRQKNVTAVFQKYLK